MVCFIIVLGLCLLFWCLSVGCFGVVDWLGLRILLVVYGIAVLVLELRVYVLLVYCVAIVSGLNLRVVFNSVVIYTV